MLLFFNKIIVMDGACGTHDGREICTGFRRVGFKEDLGVDGRMILKCILNK